MPFFSPHVTPTLLQILQALFLSLDDGAHAPQGGPFELLAAVQGVPVLHQSHVVLGDTAGTAEQIQPKQSPRHVQKQRNQRPLLVNQVLGNIDLPQSQFVVVFVIQNVHQIRVKRMNVLKQKHNVGSHIFLL